MADAPTADELLAHTDWLTGLARALVGDEASDVVQDTYEIALAQPPKKAGPLRPWLGGVARNLARMTTRGRVRRERRELATGDLVQDVPTPDQLVERVQMQQLVGRIVLELPEPLRATLLLRFYEGMSAADIARAQGIPDATVRGRIKDALDRVRATLDRQHGGRKQWAVLLVPLHVGGIVVKTSTKLAIVALVVLIAVLGSRFAGLWGSSSSDSKDVATTTTTPPPRTPVAPPAQVKAVPRSLPAREQIAIFDDDPKGAIRLEGQVIDEHDAPVGGAQVAIDSHPTTVVEADASGNFVFEGLVPRDYRIEATGGDGYAGPVRLHVSAKSEPVTLRMKKAGIVEVSVTASEGGAPVANADVELRSALVWTGKTDGKGVATLRGVGGEWAPLAVSASGFAPAAIMLGTSGDPAAPSRVAVALSRGAAIAGRVVDEQKKPVANVRVVATSASEPFPVVDPRRDGVVTKPDGTFSFPALAAGTWRLTATDSEHGPTTSAPLAVDGTHARTGVELVMSAGGVVRGKVVDRDGKPVASAEIRAVVRGHLDWRARRQALTGTDGMFSISGLPLREMDVVAASDAGASAITPVDLHAKPQAELTLTLDVSGAITGTVVDASGAPVGDAQISAEPDWSGNTGEREAWVVRGRQEAVSDQGGGFKLTGLPDGAYKLRATPPGAPEAAMSLATPVIARPGPSPVTVTVARDGRVIGKVQLDGKPVARMVVEVGDLELPFSGGELAMAVAAGTHTVVIRGPGFVSKTIRDVAIADGKDTDLGTIAVAAGRSVSGRVLDAQGRPVAKAKVAAGAMLTGGGKELYIPDESPGAKDTDTDDDGQFTLDGFGPGSIAIVAGKDDLGRSPSLKIPASNDSATVDLVLQPTTGLDGKIVRDGKPAGDVVIIANPIGTASQAFFTTTGPDGTFALDALAPGPYLVYPMFGGGGPKPKDMYMRKVDVTAGTRANVQIDASPGPLTLVVEVDGADGKPTLAQVAVVEAAVDVTALDQLRDGAGIPFADKVIPMYVRATLGGPAEIAVARPGVHTACAVPMGADDPRTAPFACQKVELTSGSKTLRLALPKSKS